MQIISRTKRSLLRQTSPQHSVFLRSTPTHRQPLCVSTPQSASSTIEAAPSDTHPNHRQHRLPSHLTSPLVVLGLSNSTQPWPSHPPCLAPSPTPAPVATTPSTNTVFSPSPSPFSYPPPHSSSSFSSPRPQPPPTAHSPTQNATAV